MEDGTDEVTREAELPADPARVWRSLTEPGLLAEWLGEEARLEPAPGGDLALRTHDGAERTGWIEAAEPPRRLVFWWRDGPDADPTRVELELEEAGEGTRILVTESRPLARLELQATQLVDGGGRAPGGPQMLLRA